MTHPSPQPAGFESIVSAVLDPGTWHGALIYAGILVAAGLFASRLLRLGVRRLLVRNRHVDRTVVLFLLQIGQVVIFVLALMIFLHIVPALQKLGTALLAGVSIVSVVIGLAAQSTLANFIAGCSLLLYRPFHLDDILMVTTPSGPEVGVVEQMTLGYTMLRTFDGRRIMVPNATMATQVTLSVNHAKLAALAVIPIGVLDLSYADSVRAKLFDRAQHSPDVIGMVRCQERPLASGGVVLSLRAWCRTQDAADRLRRTLSDEIVAAFPRAVIARPPELEPAKTGTAAANADLAKSGDGERAARTG